MSLHNFDGNHTFRDFARGFQTKNLVKGMNGGVRGVDFQDDNAEAAERVSRALADGTAASAQVTAALAAVASVGGDMFDQADLGPDFRLVVPDIQAQQASIDSRRRQEAADRIRKKIQEQWAEDEDVPEDEEDEEEEEVEEAGAPPDDLPVTDAPDTPFASRYVDKVLRRAELDVIETLMADPQVELKIYGTLRLQSPQEMRAALGTPLRVARHLNVLARRLSTQPDTARPTVVAYVASCIHALGAGFGQSVLASFMNGVGIGEVYPLEVVEHLPLMDPQFVPNLSRGPVFTGPARVELFEGVAGRVHAPADLKVTAFALKGGGNVGYEFFPADEPGAFHLLVDTAGKYKLLFRGTMPDKHELLQELRVDVRPDRRQIPRDEPTESAATKAPVPAAASPLGRRSRARPVPTHFAGLSKKPID